MIKFELRPDKLSKKFPATETGQIFSIDANIDSVSNVVITFSRSIGEKCMHNLNPLKPIVNFGIDCKSFTPTCVEISINKEDIQHPIGFTLQRLA